MWKLLAESSVSSKSFCEVVLSLPEFLVYLLEECSDTLVI